MANNLTSQQAFEILHSGQGIEDCGFAILQAVAREITNDPDSRIAKELVLRILDCRDSFHDFEDILNSLVHKIGLYPYLNEKDLDIQTLLALEYHRPDSLDGIVFHQEQSPVYHRILAGQNVVLSAPTSFGKSKIIDAVIARKKFANIVIVVPTLALIDETRRRLQAQFSSIYNIVGHPLQTPQDGNNVFIFTPERVIAYAEKFPRINFFVIDEFYKMGGQNEEDRRVVALNEAFYILYKKHHAQFYMLGPNIRTIAEGASKRFNFEFISTDFQTVAVDVIPIHASSEGDRLNKLINLCKEKLREPTLIYCRSTKRVDDVAEALLGANVLGKQSDTDDIVEWLGMHFHPEWILPKALKAGIAIHYGPLPRSIAQDMVRLFNDGRIQYLICTSTLIEGVNTKAKNVVVFDNRIAKEKLDYFTFNNIKGRSGRMFEHFIGHVYRFHDEPQLELPFVDFPIHSQDSNTPESLLIQIDPEDLEESSRERLNYTINDSPIPRHVLQENHGIEPALQIELANAVIADIATFGPLLAWSGIPQYEQLRTCCELIWNYWVGVRKNGITSASQLTFKIWSLQAGLTVHERIDKELEPGRYAAKNVNEAVKRILTFDRSWASFDFPQYLMALDRIQQTILSSRSLPAGDYSFFAKQVESLFMPELCSVLDEYGIPGTVTQKCNFLKKADSLDSALSNLSKHRISSATKLHPYEKELLLIAQNNITNNFPS